MNKTSLWPVAAAFLVLTVVGAARASDVCGDLNDSGNVNTSDALVLLKSAVGQDVELICEPGPLSTSFGYPTDFMTSDTFSENYLLGIPVEITEKCAVTHFGAIAADSGQTARFALYTDKDGEPDALVIGSSPTLLKGGMQEVRVPTTLVEAGTYWLMALYDKEATMGSSLTFDQKVHYRALDFGDPYPDPFGVADAYEGSRFNYWVKVQLAP